MQQHGMQQPLPPPNPPPHMMQGHPGHHGPGGHVHHNMADAMPPGSVTGVGSVATPKSTNPLLYVGIAFGVLAILGIAGIVFYFVSGKEGGGTTTPTSVASTSPPSPTNSAPPPPPATNEPKAVADVADASTAPTAEDPTPAPTTPTPAPPATDVNPTPPPVPVPTQTTAPTHTPPAPTATVTPPAPKEKDAGGPTADPNAFNESVARSRLAQANSVLVFCKRDGWVNGPGTASVTFNTDGTVGSVAMNPPYAGTPAGDCVAGHFKRAKTNPFQGTQRTLIHSFEVPK